MSTLKVDTVQHNTSGFNNVVTFADGAGTENGTLCRAWVNFNGTGTPSIFNDFNVSSISDEATGDYTINFSNALSNANYAVASIISVNGSSGANGGWNIAFSRNAAPTTSGFRVETFTATTFAESDIVTLAIFGE